MTWAPCMEVLKNPAASLRMQRLKQPCCFLGHLHGRLVRFVQDKKMVFVF